MIPKEDLERMYLEEFMSSYEIAERLGVCRTTITDWLRFYRIRIRTTSESWLKGIIKPTKEDLMRMYLEDNMNLSEIGNKIGVSNVTIGKWLKKYKIPMRNISEAKLKGAIKPSKEDLEWMYLNENMSTSKIGEKLSVNNCTVGNWLKSYKIPVRTMSEAKLKGAVKPSKEELERMYIEDMMDTVEIGEKIRVSPSTVRNWLKGCKIPIRNISETKLKGATRPLKEDLEQMYLDEQMSTYDIAIKLEISSCTIGRWLNEYGIQVRTMSEIRLNGLVKPSKEDLERMYLKEMMSSVEISNEIKISISAVGNWLREYGIPVRTMSEARLNADLTGEKNPSWKGGISFFPYCEKFNNVLKERIRNRDNRTCQNCRKTEADNGEKHSIHHIHYDKENCYPDLITLCRSCNAKANNNRDEWELCYMNKLNERGLLYWTLNNQI